MIRIESSYEENNHLLQLFLFLPYFWIVTNEGKAELKSFIKYAPISSADTILFLSVGIAGITKLNFY